MPKIPGIPDPYWFFFCSFDCNEPMHVHVRRDRQQAKFWLAPVALAWNHGFGARELNDLRRLIVATSRSSLGLGMSTAVNVESRISNVEVTDEAITAQLVDGRVISVPLAWSWRLSEASPAQRRNWQLIGDGHGVHWPEVDEDISADGMLTGIPAHRPPPRGSTTPAKRPLQPTSRAKPKAKSRPRSRAARG